MKKASKEQIAIDNALSGMFRKIEGKAREILAEDGDPIVNAYRVIELVRQWEKARDALIKLDDIL